jgi:hypothetical protein
MTDGSNQAVEVASENGPKLQTYLEGRKVSRILFIDDAFDPLDAVEPTQEEREELWSALLNLDDDEATIFLGNNRVSQAEDLTAQKILELLSTPESPARTAVEESSFVVEHRSKEQSLRFAISYLQSLGIEVLTAGRDQWRDKLAGVNIVFLDWRLGPESNIASAMANATDTAREIHGSADRPMIVLISSDPSVKEQARSFSLASGLIAGLFDAMPKTWIADQVGVDLQMTVLGEHLQKGYVVQGFIDAISARATDAIGTFIRTVQGLTLSDYANLQHFSLKKDGHPLGEYVAELLAGAWGDALFQGTLRDQLNELDRADFESLPSLGAPSTSLTDLYNSAVFDTHVGDLGPHPHLEAGAALERPLLSLGDVFVETENNEPIRAYIVMNPQCDLAESPRENRKIDDDLSVLLVPGTFHEISTPERTERKELSDTPFFKPAGGKAQRIHWEPTKIISVPYTEFVRWVAAPVRQRRARMRPMYALALQRSVGSQLTRVGLSAAPPLHETLKVTMRPAFGGTWNGDAVTIDQGRLVMSRHTKGDQIVLTPEFVVSLTETVRDGVVKLRASNKAGDSSNADAIATALSDPSELQKIIRPFVAPDKTVSLLGGAVKICRESHVPKPSFDRKHIVCISIPDAEAVH